MLYKVELNDSIVIHESITLKGKKGGKGKAIKKIKKGDSFTHCTGDWANREMIVDTENNTYDEVVRNSKGETIHEVHTPLNKKDLPKVEDKKNE
jgi:hypothetical protein